MDLGPSPASEIRNEDTEFGRRLMAAGERLRYEPSAVVYHVMPQDRIRKEYFLTSWFDYGRSRIREVGKRPDILGFPQYYFTTLKAIGVTSLRTLRWMLALNPQRRFYNRCLVWMTAGWIVETYRQSRRKET